MTYKENREKNIQMLINRFPVFKDKIVIPEEYDNDITHISQSGIKCFIKDGPEAYKKYHKQPRKPSSAEYFVLGTLIEMFLTGNEEAIIDKYDIFKGRTPTDMMLLYCNKLAESVKVKGNFTWLIEDDYKLAHNASGYKITYEATKKKFEEGGYQEYVTSLASGKLVISEDLAIKAHNKANILLKGDMLNALMSPDKSHNECIVIDDLCIFDGMFKIRIDRLIYDLETKHFNIVDFKTTSKPLIQFAETSKEYGYNLQLSLYEFIIKGLTKSNLVNSFIVAIEMGEFDIADYFILSDNSKVECLQTIHKYAPVIYGMDQGGSLTTNYLFDIDDRYRQI